MNTRIASITLVAMAAACGSSIPPPNDEWAQAQADVGRAQSAGAPSVPDAKLHLQLAEEDLQKSHDLIGQDNRRAESLIALARTEAQLAFSLARAAQSIDAANQATAELQRAKAAGGVQ